MPIFHVKVTASYDRDAALGETFANLREWASNGHDRTFEIDHSIEPVRWTATVVYREDSATAEEAERQAARRFAAESVDHGISGPETLLAQAD
jgi:hypothetical protein